MQDWIKFPDWIVLWLSCNMLRNSGKFSLSFESENIFDGKKVLVPETLVKRDKTLLKTTRGNIGWFNKEWLLSVFNSGKLSLSSSFSQSIIIDLFFD